MPELINLFLNLFKKTRGFLENIFYNGSKNRGNSPATVRSELNGFSTRIATARDSLAFNVVSITLLIFFIQLVLLGGTNYFRSRSSLNQQATNQLQGIAKFQGDQLEKITTSAQETLTGLASQPNLLASLKQLNSDPENQEKYILASDQLVNQLSNYKIPSQASIGLTFDQLAVILPDGKVLASTNNQWRSQDFSHIPAISQILGTNKSIAFFNPAPLYYNDLIVFTAHTLPLESGQPQMTIMGSSVSFLPLTYLLGAGSFFQFGHAYLLTEDSTLVGVDPTGQKLIQIFPDQAYLNQLNASISKGGGLGNISLPGNQRFITYTKTLPQNQATLVLEVPEYFLFKQITLLDPFNLVLFAISLLITGIIVYFGSTIIVNPLLQLYSQARKFAEGDLTQRSSIKRRDEIGLLSQSFNRMGDELSGLYRSMELRVEDRTKQIRLATEIAQTAASAARREDIFLITTQMVVDKFGYAFASIFLLDETGKYAVLQGKSGDEDPRKPLKNYKVPVGDESLIGWVTANNQTRTIIDPQQDPFAQSELLQPDTRSEVAVPIAINNLIIGLIEIQSQQTDAFDPQTISVLHTMAYQIATSLQRLRLVESAEVNLEVTSLLYRASRQITQAKNEHEVIQTLMNTLGTTSYVSAMFKVEENFLTVIAIKDPRNPGAASTTQGITLPLQRIIPRLSESHILLVDNLAQPSDFNNILSFFARRGCRSAALFAINESGELAKILVLGDRGETSLTMTGIQPFANLIDVVGSTTEKLQVLISLQRRLKDFQTLSYINQVISTEIEIHQLYRLLQQQITQIMGSDLGFMVATYSADTQMIEVPFISEGNEMLSIEPYPLGEGLTSYLIQNKQPLLLVRDTDRKAQEMGVRIVGRAAKSWMGVPLFIGNEILGALVIQDTKREERFNENDLELLNALAPQIAAAIRNAQLLSELQQTVQTFEQDRELINSWLRFTPDAIYFKDIQGQYLRISDAFIVRNNMQSPENVIGKDDFQIFGENIGEQSKLEELNIIETGKSQIGKVEQVISADGKENWFLVTKIPVRDVDGKIAGILGISRDITTFKEAEELAQQRSQQLRTAAEIARDSSGTLEINELLLKSVNLIRERFGFYHASIFLLDPLAEYAILRESTGEAGARMKAAGHKLAVASQSIIGQTTSIGEALVVNNVTQDVTYYPNPLLPDTRSELAVPLKAGDKILGALDVQSIKVNAFSEESISTLRILADQLAVAVYNANLFAKTEETLGQHRLMHQITTEAASKENVEDVLISTVQALHSAQFGERVAFYILDDQKNIDLGASAGYRNEELLNVNIAVSRGIIKTVLHENRHIRINDLLSEPDFYSLSESTRAQLAVPISYTNNLLGILIVESSTLAAFDEEDQEILATLGNNLGAIIFSVNLLGKVRRQVERQRLLYEITSKIRRAVDVPTVLQTSANEIGRVLNANRARIEITIGKTPQDTPHENGGNGKSKEVSQ